MYAAKESVRLYNMCWAALTDTLKWIAHSEFWVSLNIKHSAVVGFFFKTKNVLCFIITHKVWLKLANLKP